MSETSWEQQHSGDRAEDDAERGEGEASHAEHDAARDEPGEDEESVPQDATEDTRIDTEEHSDAPGPSGTG